MWENWVVTNNLTACTQSSDCTETHEDCGTLSLGATTGKYCVAYDGWCSVDGGDGGIFPVNQSENELTATCTSTDYLIWLWQI